MKKLIMVAAIACAATLANAATANWGVGYIEDENGNVLGGSSIGYIATFNIYQDAAMTILVTSSSSSTWDEGYAEGVSENVLINTSDTDYYGQIIITHGSATMKSNGFKFTTNSLSDETYVYVMNNDEVEGVVNPDGSAFEGTNGAFETSGGAWTTAGDVPEPTSGLLLLVGAAALALKRKVA